MTTLSEKRRAVQALVSERDPADAQTVYYLRYYPDEKVQLITYPPDGRVASGFVCMARTGLDLFRPLVTLRLPFSTSLGKLDLEASTALIYEAISVSSEVIINAPMSYRPLLEALFEVRRLAILKLLVLERGLFEPIINVLVSRSESYDGQPRFVIRHGQTGGTQGQGDIITSAGLNWQSPNFAEVYVHTKSPFRRQGMGRSVVAAAVQYVLDSGRTPLYVADVDNGASIQLAESVGFVDNNSDLVLIEGTLRAKI